MKKMYAGILCLLMLTLTLGGCTQTSPTPAPEAAQTDTSWSDVQAAGKLIVGLDDTFAPMGFRDTNGDLVGFDIDLARAVADVLGVEAVFQPIDWDAKEMELSTKKIDCIWNGMSSTPERQSGMSLTKPYLNNRIVVMMNDGITIATKDDMINYNIGTQAKSAALEVLKADPLYEEMKDKVFEYRSYDDCILDMQAGRIDAMIVDEVLGQYKNSLLDPKLAVASFDFGDDFYVIGFRKSDTALTLKVQETIGALITSGEAVLLSEKWFGANIILAP